MTTATEVLRQEHDAILRMLETAEAVASRLARNVPVPPATLEGLLEFFRLFADRCHHGKEEDLLFPLLERKGLPRHGGPIGVMLIEHDQGRELIRQMVRAAEEYRAGQSEAGARWATAAGAYVPLLREHIYKENNILFVMAERMLSEQEQNELAAQFEKVEKEKLGEGTHERLHRLMEELAASVKAG